MRSMKRRPQSDRPTVWRHWRQRRSSGSRCDGSHCVVIKSIVSVCDIAGLIDGWQVADATFAAEGPINAAVEAWYTSAGWVGNKVGPRPRTARPPPNPNTVLAALVATLHQVQRSPQLFLSLFCCCAHSPLRLFCGRCNITICCCCLHCQVPHLEDLEPIAVASDSASEVKKAYLKAARVIHPDKLTGASLEVS